MAALECFLALCIFLLASSTDGLQELTVHPGQDVTLECRGPNDVPIIMLEWTRPDLESPEYVFFYRDERSDPTYQNPSFEDRVELQDREMKNGDLSLILTNVNRNDTGTYECRCLTGGARRSKRANIHTEPSSIIILTVEEPDQEAVRLQLAAGTMDAPAMDEYAEAAHVGDEFRAAHARAAHGGDEYDGVGVGVGVGGGGAVGVGVVSAVLLMLRKRRDINGHMDTKKQVDKKSDPTPADEACAQLV